MASKVKYPDVDLRKVGSRVARALVAAMKRAITQKKTTGHGPVAPNAASTIRRKGKDHRNVDTGKFRANALTVSVRKLGFVIDLNEAKHPKGPTYEQIGEYNQLGHPNENTRSANHKWFGISEADYKWASETLEKELRQQLVSGTGLIAHIEIKM